MCWCFPLNISNDKQRKPKSSSGEKKRRERDRQPAEPHHASGSLPAVAEVQEKRRSKESPKKRRSRETVTVSPRSPRRERERERENEGYRHGHADYQYRAAYNSRDQYRPALNLQVPDMWHRSVDVDSGNSSQEMLLNPRPHRSQHHRQRHPKRTSQTTLRGRGAKRDPPRKSKSKRSVQQQSPRSGWSFLVPSPPKTPSRSHRNYQTLESSPRSNRSSRHHHQSTPRHQEAPESSQAPQRHHRSRQHQRQPPSTRQARSQTPNTAVHRTPDRRFAVLAATNQALEDLRREAFAQPSPPPRRQRVQRYQGTTVPTSSIPFNWDCISSSQTSAGGESSNRHRRHRN